MSIAYLIFLDGEKHSIWNNENDALRQVDTLAQLYNRRCISIEELPNVFLRDNGIYFL